jgi:hypothetical protein
MIVAASSDRSGDVKISVWTRRKTAQKSARANADVEKTPWGIVRIWQEFVRLCILVAALSFIYQNISIPPVVKVRIHLTTMLPH